MQLRPDIQIKSMIKAISEVIVPAIEPMNELAVQQAQLLIGHLALMASRMPLQYRADRDDLIRNHGYAARLAALDTEAEKALSAEISRAADILNRAQADPSELLDASRSLTAALDAPIRRIFEVGSDETRSAIQSLTLAMSEEQLLRDRAWLIMQGWEPDPAAVPAIETLLSPLSATPDA